VDSSSTQMQIINVSNPSSMSIVGQVMINAGAGRDVSVSTDGTRVYLATANSSSYNEFHIIDTSTKTGNRSVLGSVNSASMSPNSIALLTYNRVVMVGSGGTQQYQVFDITNESAPSQCGGMSLSNTPYSVAGVNNFNGNAYSYVVTGNSSSELEIIR
jgi:hypothetical protein